MNDLICIDLLKKPDIKNIINIISIIIISIIIIDLIVVFFIIMIIKNILD